MCLQDALMAHSMVHNFRHEPNWPTVASMNIAAFGKCIAQPSGTCGVLGIGFSPVGKGGSWHHHTWWGGVRGRTQGGAMWGLSLRWCP